MKYKKTAYGLPVPVAGYEPSILELWVKYSTNELLGDNPCWEFMSDFLVFYYGCGYDCKLSA
jgi:hypothetical protein